MEYNINLSKDECDFIINALQYLENENLSKSLIAIQNTKYENVKGFYADEHSFKSDMKYKEKIINEQVQAINEIIEKLENGMNEED